MAVATGDFNGDGKPDAAVTSSGGLTTFLNDGTGALTGPVTMGTGSSFPRVVRVADLTGDGKLDVVTGNDIGWTVSVFKGNGDGTFQAPVVVTVGGANLQGLAVADFNGDGQRDVAVSTDASVAVLFGTGTAAVLGSPTFYPLGVSPAGRGLDAADFDGDGKPDLALAEDTQNRVGVLLNQGNRTFGAIATYPTGTGSSPWGLIANTADGTRLDVNGDGKTDLAVGYNGIGFVGVLLGNGDGTFAAPTTYSTSLARAGRLVAADFDLDGKLDLAVQVSAGGTTTQAAVLLGTGGGAFATGVAVGAATNATDVTAADLDGDGLPDVLTTSSDSPGHVAVTRDATPVVTSFLVSAVPAATAGQGFDVTVTARDQAAATLTGYTGTVHFTGTDPLVPAGSGLPADYQFLASENGVHTFTGAVLKSAGSRTVTVTDTVRTTATGSTDVTVGPAATVAVVSGGGQSATVNTAFGSPLVAKVADVFGNPVPSVVVEFTVPGSGAAAGLTASTATTDANGQVSVEASANSTAGGYAVTASVNGVATPAPFPLTNTPGAPANVVSTSGTPQSTTVGTMFSDSLVVTVSDAFGNPIPGVTVTFAGPASGATAEILGGTTVTTGADGRAVATAVANGVGGGYTVTAAAAGVAAPASFALTNTVPPPPPPPRRRPFTPTGSRSAGRRAGRPQSTPPARPGGTPTRRPPPPRPGCSAGSPATSGWPQGTSTATGSRTW
jgi:hypothetical protein